jgi:hypothetical protein
MRDATWFLAAGDIRPATTCDAFGVALAPGSAAMVDPGGCATCSSRAGHQVRWAPRVFT